MGEVIERVAPVLVFLIAITVLAELADSAGVFDVIASRAARAARGRTWVLFALTALLAAITTIVLSLDTTAVLLTPVVLAIAQQLDLNPIPFALATVWLANTASLLLPVSNLTNLLAVDRLDLTPTAYVGRMALPALVAVAVTVVFLAVWQRKSLRGAYVVPERHRPEDRWRFRGNAAACALLVPTLLLGLPFAWAAGLSAAVAIGVTVWRAPSAVHLKLIPGRLVIGVLVLFLVVDAVGPHGLDDLLRHGIGAPLQTSFVAAGGANLVNNLPAYLAMERVVPHDQLLALLLGVNLGPLVLPWGSLATLLWADRCRARGVTVGWFRFAAAGLLLVPLLLVTTVALL